MKYLPLFYQHNINEYTRLAVWRIEEDESFFIKKVSIRKNIMHPHKRLQHLAGRYLLQLLFADFPYEEIQIADTKKPFLPNEQYHFSISHCSSYAAAIVSSDQRVGIDIEVPTHRVLKIAHKFLSEKEREIFVASSSDIQLLTLLWCAKEAMFKWWGWGEVDFSEMLQLQFFRLEEEGVIQSVFIKQEITEPLLLYYKVFEEINLCWVCQ